MSLRVARLGAKGDDYTGLFFEPIEEWSQFFTPCNWRTFRPFLLELEDDRLLGGVEATVVLLGVGFRVRWNYARTDKVDEISAAVDGILAGSDLRRTHPTYPVDSDDEGGSE